MKAKNNEIPMLKVALEYLAVGFPAIPVRKDKTPCINWKEFQKHLPTKEEIRNWWAKYPDANIAVVMLPSFVVLDIDDKALAETVLKKGVCKKTIVEKTPSGGVHIWFRETQANTKTENLRNKYSVKAEIRTHGTYLIVPPSEGYRYLSNPMERKIMVVPDAGKEALEILGISNKCIVQKPVEAKRQIVTEPLKEGIRDDTLTSIAGTLFKRVQDYPAVLSVLKGLNKELCKPPLPDEQIETIARSIYKSELAGSEEKKKWRSFAEIKKATLPELDWIWNDYLARGITTLFSGLAKAGKTTLLFHFLQALERGEKFISSPTKMIGKVLILTEEPEQIYRKHIDDYGLNGENILTFSSYDVNGWPWEKIASHVREGIDEEGISLVVIDTLSSFWRVLDENDAPTVHRAIEVIRMIAKEKNVAVLLIFHLRKSDGSHATASRGSGALVADVDAVLEFRYSNTHTQTPSRRVLQSYSRLMPSKEILIELTEEGYRLLGDAEKVKREDVKKRFIEALPIDEFEALDDINKKLDPPASAAMLRGIAKECRKNKLVDFTGKGVRGDQFKYRCLSNEKA